MGNRNLVVNNQYMTWEIINLDIINWIEYISGKKETGQRWSLSIDTKWRGMKETWMVTSKSFVKSTYFSGGGIDMGLRIGKKKKNLSTGLDITLLLR